MNRADMWQNRRRSLLKTATLGWYGRRARFQVMQMEDSAVYYTTGTKRIGWDGQQFSHLGSGK
jgi:hypothetical protein